MFCHEASVMKLFNSLVVEREDRPALYCDGALNIPDNLVYNLLVRIKEIAQLLFELIRADGPGLANQIKNLLTQSVVKQGPGSIPRLSMLTANFGKLLPGLVPVTLIE